MTLIVLSVGTFIAETLPAYRIDLTSKVRKCTNMLLYNYNQCLGFGAHDEINWADESRKYIPMITGLSNLTISALVSDNYGDILL